VLLSSHIEAEENGECFTRLIFVKDAKSPDAPVGAITLMPVDVRNGNAQLTFWCAVGHQRRGYATEAAVRVIQWAFEDLGLERIHSTCDTENDACAKVLENAGMINEGTLRHAYMRGNKFADYHQYAILRSDWERQKDLFNIQLESERLFYRPMRHDDAESVQRAFDYPAYSDLTSHIPYPYTLENAKAFIRKTHRLLRENKAFFFGIFLKENGHFIGEAHIHWIEWKVGLCELGFGLDQAYTGQGHATEAAKEMVRYAFEDLGMHRIFALTMSINDPTRNLLERIGFDFEGIARDEWKQRDNWVDFAHYGLLKSDWESGR
jgi:RimJ/RimL family protein N-acetyltransferase